MSSEIIIYQSADGVTKIETKLENETIWLTQAQLVELYNSSKANISEHIKNIFGEGELDTKATVRNFRTVQTEGKREVSRDIEHYNLDMIISLGYRINSKTATAFRKWATERLREYIIKGFTMDDERMKNLGGGDYWKELLDRIRDIRSSEKVMYRQVLDLFATSMDYDPNADESILFFKIVQNKLHYAAHGHTAAEIVYYRVDSDKSYLGLTSFTGKKPTQAEAMVAKNYLSETELRVLNNIVSGYFDMAEINAIEHTPMYMKDYVEQLDAQLKAGKRKLLHNAGKISHADAVDKAKTEYRKYEAKNLSDVEEAYLAKINVLKKEVKKKVKK
ncbi:MAG: virulence RhuM family protein [Lachnospiraceae bacterium]|nr:virulence RhuM family protein [Lachnospiraceae bacterium]